MFQIVMIDIEVNGAKINTLNFVQTILLYLSQIPAGLKHL